MLNDLAQLFMKALCIDILYCYFYCVQIEPGLGLSESLYSWSITTINIGACVGALFAGFILKVLPYWLVTFGALLLHTVGYLLYALATNGWMMMLSCFMTGAFVGAEFTFSPAYFSESYDEYISALTEAGMKANKRFKAKDVLNAAHGVSMAIGTAIGTGEASLQLMCYSFRMCAITVSFVYFCTLTATQALQKKNPLLVPIEYW